VFASGVEYRLAAVSILKLGEVAAMSALTEMVYVPAGITTVLGISNA